MSLLGQELANGLVTGGAYALTAVGLSLIFGVLNVANFAHGELYMVGGFIAYLATAKLGVPYLAALLLAGAGGAVIGVVAERVAIRPLRNQPEETVFLSTFALSLVLLYAVKALLGAQPRAVSTDFTGTRSLGGVVISDQRLLVIAMAAVAVASLFAWLRYTKFGLAIRAVAENRETAGLMGMDTDRIYSVTFAAAAALAAIAGAVVAPLFTINPYVGQDVVIKAFIVIIVAGMGSLSGAVAVGLGLGMAENLAAGYLPSGSRDFIGYLLVGLVLALRPSGLFRSVRTR